MSRRCIIGANLLSSPGVLIRAAGVGSTLEVASATNVRHGVTSFVGGACINTVAEAAEVLWCVAREIAACIVGVAFDVEDIAVVVEDLLVRARTGRVVGGTSRSRSRR